ncbi:MAG: alpha/beta fold hydrolase [Acidimicrobiales bacterium]
MAIQKAAANGITLAYEEIGDPAGRPLLLVNGLGSQMNGWHPEFCDLFAGRGYRVVRFDNRDVGESTHFTQFGLPPFLAASGDEAGSSSPAYLLEDMADDAAGLLDALGMAPAHVLGASMGGMIAQALTIRHGDKVRSLTSIMSTPSRSVGQATPETGAALLLPRPADREAAIEQAVQTFRLISSPGFEFDEQWRRDTVAAAFDRDPDPYGRGRQLFAILRSPDRAPGLANVRVPALVIHGAADQLVQPSGGRATAEAIPGAELMIIEGMGHDLPRAVWGRIVDRVVALTDQADGIGVSTAESA